MNQMNAKFFYAIVFLLFCTVIIVGCQPTPEEIYHYSVSVIDDAGNPVKDVQVALSIAGQPPIRQLTDSHGVCIFIIPLEYTNQVGNLSIDKEGFHSETRVFKIDNNTISEAVRLISSELPAPTKTATAVPPTHTSMPPVETNIATPQTPTNTPMSPTETYTPAQPTNTPTPTQTPTDTPLPPSPTPEGITAVGVSNTCDQFIYAGPDISNVRLGTVSVGEVVEIIGRTEMNEWFLINRDGRQDGWIAPYTVQIQSGNIEDAPVEWPGRVTPPIECLPSGATPESGGTGSTSCIEIFVTREHKSDDLFDEFIFSWGRVPAETTQVGFEVIGSVDNTNKFVVMPTFVALNGQYRVEHWQFQDGGFSHNGEYIYRATAVKGTGEEICSVAGRFSQ